MQTRIYVQKLYTKSKALYIRFHQAAASVCHESQTVKIQPVCRVLSGVTLKVPNRVTQVIYEA